MRLYLVRHGESTYNAEGRIQGQQDAPLSDVGRAQAERIADRLAGYTFAACYASDLARAADTARAIMKRHPNVPFEFITDLREIAFGIFEGLTAPEIQVRYPDEYAEWMAGHDAIPGTAIRTYTPPNAESAEDLHVRAGKALNGLRAQAHDGAILVVAHGGILRSLVVNALGLSPEHRGAFHFDNTALSVLEDEPWGASLRLLNDTSHLGAQSLFPAFSS